MTTDNLPKPPETYAGMSPGFPASGQLFDRGACRRSVSRHLEVWAKELNGGWTNNDAVFPKEQLR